MRYSITLSLEDVVDLTEETPTPSEKEEVCVYSNKVGGI